MVGSCWALLRRVFAGGGDLDEEAGEELCVQNEYCWCKRLLMCRDASLMVKMHRWCVKTHGGLNASLGCQNGGGVF
jgi:hypothetical protein